MAEKLSGAEMKSEIAILFWLSQGLQGYKTLESTTSGLGVMSHFASVVAIAPPMGRFGWDFDTFSSNWGLPPAEFQVSRPYGLGCTLRFTAEKGKKIAIINNIKAASSIKRGSCFEGIRVCFYGLGQPWFIGDSETHRKWTTGSQKHTHKHMFNCLW